MKEGKKAHTKKAKAMRGEHENKNKLPTTNFWPGPLYSWEKW